MSSLSRLHKDALSVWQTALQAADAYQIARQALKLTPHPTDKHKDKLAIHNDHGQPTDEYILTHARDAETEANTPYYTTVALIGIGKAAIPECAAALQALGDYITQGHIVTKEDKDNIHVQHLQTIHKHTHSIGISYGGHPVPTQDTLNGTQQVLHLLHKTAEDPHCLVLVLLSGGASALFEQPVSGITLDDLIALNTSLLHCGANIYEMNTIRRGVSCVKGGKLLNYVGKATLVSCILSDVCGNDLTIIGSGPTMLHSQTEQQELAVRKRIINKYRLQEQLPDNVLRVLAGGKNDSHDRKQEHSISDSDTASRVSNVLIGSSLLTVSAAADWSRSHGYNALCLTDRLSGDVDSVSCLYAAMVSSIAHNCLPIAVPAAIIVAGETTVTISDHAKKAGLGQGGRNQHLALSLAAMLDEQQTTLDGIDVVFVAAGTDGVDGASDAAGAIITNKTIQQAAGHRQTNKLDAQQYLERFDSYGFFSALSSKSRTDVNQNDLLSCHIKTGPTGTNVMDFAVLLVDKPATQQTSKL